MPLPRMSVRRRRAFVVALTLAAVPCGARAAVSHATGTVNGIVCDIWTWTDSAGQPRTVALKQEGAGNPGHGGYAVQMTYFYHDAARAATGLSPWVGVTVNAANGSDGGFGYFVSHERYRYFNDGSFDTIAGKMFGQDDSPLGRDFLATSQILPAAHPTAERFAIAYSHYGTTAPAGFNADNGQDCGLDASVTGGADCVGLPTNLHQGNGLANYKNYALPVTTTWLFESGKDYPRIDISIDMSQLIPTGATMPAAGLVSFDVRGPYGVMVFDNGADATVTDVQWGDRQFLFAPASEPVERGDGWNWNKANSGARFNLLRTGRDASSGFHSYEMGLYEPKPAARSALADDCAGERGYTAAGYKSAGGASADQCGDAQKLPSDGTWPYQSVQYSLPCRSDNPHYLSATTTGKKIAWGSAPYYGFNQTSVYNGRRSYPINNFPVAPYKFAYSVCLVLGTTNGLPQPTASSPLPVPAPATLAAASLYTSANPANANCATTTVP